MAEELISPGNGEHAGTPSHRKRKFDDFENPDLLQPLGRFEELENTWLPAGVAAPQNEAIKSSPDCPAIHKVNCFGGLGHENHYSTAAYLDCPRLFANDTRASALRGNQFVNNVQQHLDRYEELCAVIYRNYSCQDHHRSVDAQFERLKPPKSNSFITPIVRPYLSILPLDTPEAECNSEELVVVSESVTSLLSQYDGLEDDRSKRYTMQAPYLDFYRHRESLEAQLATTQDAQQREHLKTVSAYIYDTFGQEYEEADTLFSQGKVSQQHFTKLFSLNEVVVAPHELHPRAYFITSISISDEFTIELNCWSWDFDGQFRQSDTSLEVEWPQDAVGELRIEDLSAYPLRFDKQGTEDRLKRRGGLFWSFRAGKFVGYDAREASFDIRTTNPRFMIDVPAYHNMHPNETREALQQGGLSPEEMQNDELPSEQFALLLPPTVKGYGFHDKKWKTLSVELIREVTWNDTAFEKLVLEDHKKEIIKALVQIHTATFSSSTDIIEGKGNGLIMLLHGSPGTGKTLTAESVAELTHKPLYRVTCGDIGTDPEGVEKYLESVLYIGTEWDCVVLLDEADVFLEERKDADLQRNALVSVFLRVLEYYQGILILTSNRVGTFDEAFKSRIQLAVYYPALDEEGRREVWSEFINSLHESDDADLKEINKKIGLLASHNLNGRQIRNTVKTAKQVAAYKKEKLRYAHFRSVIDVANEFEDYLVKTKGLDDDERAQYDQIRAKFGKS